MKKILVCAVSVFFSFTGLFANDFNVWVAPEYKLYNSSFNHDSYNKKDILRVANSLDEEMLSYIGAEAGFGWRFISLQGNFDWGIPKSCGNIGVKKYNEENHFCEDLRNYNCSLDAQNFNLDTKLQFDIPVVPKWFNIRPYAGFSYYLKKYTGSFTDGRQDLSKNKSAAYLPYDPYCKISSAPDVWFKREMYDFKAGAVLHGEIFERAFIDFDFALSPFTMLNTKEYDGSMYYLDMMKDFFRQWSLGAGAGVYLGKKKQFEVGLKFNYFILNKMQGDTYYSNEENSGFKKFPDGTVKHTEKVMVYEPVLDSDGKRIKDDSDPSGTGYKTTEAWNEYSYDKNYSGIYAETSYNAWQLTIYGKYTFSFGPTHTPKAKPAREKKARAPKVRKGKVEVKQY